jgi:hypothetical protein
MPLRPIEKAEATLQALRLQTASGKPPGMELLLSRLLTFMGHDPTPVIIHSTQTGNQLAGKAGREARAVQCLPHKWGDVRLAGCGTRKLSAPTQMRCRLLLASRRDCARSASSSSGATCVPVAPRARFGDCLGHAPSASGKCVTYAAWWDRRRFRQDLAFSG